MSDYQVIWNGDKQGPFRGLLCLDPLPVRKPAVAATLLPFAAPEIQDAAFVLLALLQRQGHVCRVPALAAQCGLPEVLVATALSTLCVRRVVRRIWLPRPLAQSAVVGYRAVVDVADMTPVSGTH